MQHPTGPGRQPTVPPVIGIAWCAWHHAYSATARLVRDAAGAARFACTSCRAAHDLAPVADQP
ncbi:MULTISPECIES: hypothetical protein [unclassified Streptomyces]|uniref:hypothetical protein n=1 Tax=unclassified Streptomyces TaxID=2593676 RepID=UPI00344D1565